MFKILLTLAVAVAVAVALAQQLRGPSSVLLRGPSSVLRPASPAPSSKLFQCVLLHQLRQFTYPPDPEQHRQHPWFSSAMLPGHACMYVCMAPVMLPGHACMYVWLL